MHPKEVRSPGRTQRINKEYALGTQASRLRSVWNKLFDHTTPYLGAQANYPAPFMGRGQGAGQFATRKFVIRNT